jgi:hypothetical protein
VDSAFKAHANDSAARLVARDTVYARARRELVDVIGPQLRTIAPRLLEHVRLDNAALLARKIYDTDLDLFDAVWESEGRDLRRTVVRVVELAKRRPGDPFAALRDFRNTALQKQPTTEPRSYRMITD